MMRSMTALSPADPHEIRSQGLFWSIAFICLGGVTMLFEMIYASTVRLRLRLRARIRASNLTPNPTQLSIVGERLTYPYPYP